MSTHEYLALDFPFLSLRQLDHEIWKYPKKKELEYLSVRAQIMEQSLV